MNLRRSLTIARHELRTQLGSPLLWALLLFAAILTMSLNTAPMLSRGGGGPGAAKLFNNTPYTLAFVFGVLGFMVYGFFSSILAGLTIIRDDENRVSELLHSTPLTAGEYALGKFGGVLAALGLMLGLHVLFAVGYFQFGPLDADLLRGPFRPGAYILPALLFTAPLIWLFAGLAFAVGAWTRKPMLVFVVPTVLFMLVLSLGLQSLVSSPEPGVDRLLMTLEPSGLRWLFRTAFAVDRGVEFYNTAPLLPDRTLWLNRLITFLLPALAIWIAVRRGGEAVVGSQGKRAPGAAASPPPAPARAAAGTLADLKMRAASPGFLTSLLQVTGAELRELASQPGLYLFGALILGVVADGATSAVGPFGAPPILTAGNIAVGGLGGLTLLLCLWLMFQTVESLHRDRATRFEAILYATPLRTAALLLARNLAGGVVAAAIVLASVGVGLSLLATQEQGRLELGPFALVWGLVLAPTLIFWNAFVTFVFSISRGRYLSYAVGLGALLGTFVNLRRDWMSWPLNWTLAGALTWSDMGVFALNGRALFLNRLLAIAAAVFLLAVAIHGFARVEPDARRARARFGPAWVRSARRLAPYALPALGLAAILAYQVHTGFQGAPARERAREYRRLNRATWSEFRPPHITHVDLQIDLAPARRSMAVEGAYTLVNPHAERMDRLPFTVGPAAAGVAWTIDGTPAPAEEFSGLYVLTPATPLAAGATARVAFAFQATHPRGMTRNGGGIAQFILPSGVALHTLRDSFLPVPGFVDSIGVEPREIRDEANRVEDWTDGAPRQGPFTARVSVSAPEALTVNAVGALMSRATQDGRTTTVWETDHPVGAINLVAGRWDVRRQGDTAVFFHPGHGYNADEMLATLVAARERYSEWFHPYPWRELRLSEFPNLVVNAQGFPTNIPFSEGIGFLTRSEPETRLPFLVTAHEAAHQWWGNVVAAAEGPGTAHLVEGLAHYSALLLHESELGLEGRIAFARSMEEHYVQRRSVDSELPLAEMVDDRRPSDWTVVYEKGAWVQWMLQNHLGREPALAGIRQFIEDCVARGSRPVLPDLIEALRPQARDAEAFQEFVDQWFFRVVLPQYAITDPAVERSGDRWRVSATVANVGSGATTVEVAASRGRRFSRRDLDADKRYVDERVSLRLEPGVPTRVSLTLDFEPQRLVVDPDVLVLQSKRDQARADLSPTAISPPAAR